MSRPIAVGLAILIMWCVAGAIFAISPPTPQWKFSRWMGGGILGGIVVGLIAMAL